MKVLFKTKRVYVRLVGTPVDCSKTDRQNWRNDNMNETAITPEFIRSEEELNAAFARIDELIDATSRTTA